MNNQLKQQIIAAFEKTLVPNKTSIEEGSALLTQLKAYEGCCLMFMEITDDQTAKDQIRQAAAIQLKLTIEKRWKSKKTPPLSENEKNTIRQFLLAAFLRSHQNTKILPIYKAIVKTIMEYDYAEWSPAGDVILQIQKDPTTITGCLYFLEGIFNGASKLIQEERVILENLIQLVFPHFYEIIKNNHSLEIVFLISKIIWRGYKNLIKEKAMAESFKFMDILKNIIEYYDPNLASLYNAKIQKHTLEFFYFHSKKWACRTVWRFFQSHANAIYHDTNIQFSNKWFAQFGQSFVECLIKQIPIPSIPKAKFFQIKSLVAIANFKYELIDKYVHDLLFKDLISFILLTPKEEQIAKEDPLEYLRSEEDPVQENTNVKSVATDLWTDLAGKRLANAPKQGKKQQPPALPKYLMPAMEFLKQNLEEGDMIHKEMAMYLLCKMHRVLETIEQIKSAMPILIKSYVLPHFSNEIMLLRARAAELFSEYGSINFQDDLILKQAVEGIYFLMTKDSNPVVKLKASYAFNCVLGHPAAISMVKPYLKQILASYVKLLNEYETESLVNSLEGIVAHFSNEIGIFAYDLVKHLNNIFARYCGILKVQSNENASLDVELAAGGCIETIKRIVDSPLTVEVLQSIEPFIINIIELGFIKEGSDYCNDIMYLLSSYVTKIPSISKQMWFFYPCLFYISGGVTSPVPNKEQYSQIQNKIFQNFEQNPNSELFVDAMQAIRTYIYKGVDILTNQNDFYGTNLFMLIFNTTQKLYANQPEDELKATITALMTYILENVKQSEQLVPMMWQIIKRNMMENAFRYLRVMNSQLACMCIYASPLKFFSVVESENSLQVLFNYIFHPDSLYLNEWEKQRIVLGLSRVLTLNNRSQQLSAYIPRIMDELKKQINAIAQIRNEKQEEQENKNQNDEEQIDDFDLEDDQDDVYWEEPREDDFKTALDSVDEVEFYESAIKTFREQEPSTYSNVMLKYTAEDLETLNQSITTSKQQFAKRRIDIIRNLSEMASKGIAY